MSKPLYDRHHVALRKRWKNILASRTVNCWRCGQPITGDWDLGHRPGLPSRPEHPHCNRSAGATHGNLQRHEPRCEWD